MWRIALIRSHCCAVIQLAIVARDGIRIARTQRHSMGNDASAFWSAFLSLPTAVLSVGFYWLRPILCGNDVVMEAYAAYPFEFCICNTKLLTPWSASFGFLIVPAI